MNFENIDNGNSFDFGKTSEAYAKYRDIYPKELYDKLRELGVAADGTAWLDIGTGTGVFPKNLYKENAEITAVDISPEQISFAKAEAEKNGWNINYLVSPAEETGLPDNSFDVITAAQCFWYLDREKMKSEIKRLLKPNGKFIKVYLTFTLDDKIAEKSYRLVKRMNKNWNMGSSGSKDMFDDLFPGRKTETFYCNIPFTRESWHGRMCACRGTLASMDEETLAEWDRRHRRVLSKYPEEFTIKHKVYITCFEVK